MAKNKIWCLKLTFKGKNAEAIGGTSAYAEVLAPDRIRAAIASSKAVGSLMMDHAHTLKLYLRKDQTGPVLDRPGMITQPLPRARVVIKYHDIRAGTWSGPVEPLVEAQKRFEIEVARARGDVRLERL